MEKWEKLLQEFKAFIARGSVVDLAVGVIVGGAFSAIVKSLVNDVLMPIIGLLLGGLNFSNLSFGLGEAKIMYGAFLQAVINFFIIAFVIFFIVKLINLVYKKQSQETIKTVPEDVKLLTEIRDLLKK